MTEREDLGDGAGCMGKFGWRVEGRMQGSPAGPAARAALPGLGRQVGGVLSHHPAISASTNLSPAHPPTPGRCRHAVRRDAEAPTPYFKLGCGLPGGSPVRAAWEGQAGRHTTGGAHLWAPHPRIYGEELDKGPDKGFLMSS